jgi:hypothetical protein
MRASINVGIFNAIRQEELLQDIFKNCKLQIQCRARRSVLAPLMVGLERLHGENGQSPKEPKLDYNS